MPSKIRVGCRRSDGRRVRASEVIDAAVRALSSLTGVAVAASATSGPRASGLPETASGSWSTRAALPSRN